MKSKKVVILRKPLKYTQYEPMKESTVPVTKTLVKKFSIFN